MKITEYNYNGEGAWSVQSVIDRYQVYCQQFRVQAPRALRPSIYTQGDKRWVYPIMSAVIEGIKDDDAACTELGIDFISENQGFPFGMTLKSQTARALKKATLTRTQLDRVRTRVVSMLLVAYLPQEYRFYARLLRRTGLGQYEAELLSLEPCGRRMQKYVNYVHCLLDSKSGQGI